MTFGKFMGGLILGAIVGGIGYWLEVPTIMIGALCGVILIAYFASSL